MTINHSLESRTGERSTIGTSSVSVLIVDDNPTKRLSLRSALVPLGYSIVEAASGLGALRSVMTQDFAVILLDVRMPDMDGFETAALIRQRRESEMTPIIFVTAYASDEFVVDRYVEGAVDFMFAPVQPDELRAKVSVFGNLFMKAGELAAQAQEVKTTADQLRLLTDAAPVGIFQTDTEGRYVYTNPCWSEITGIPPEDATGREWGTIIESKERPDILVDGAEGSIRDSDLTRRFEIDVPGSGVRIVLVTARSIPSIEGGRAGWVGTLADVTAEAGAEAAMSEARDKADEASRLKSDFLANMSHEIRTPMNGVMGMAELLLETELDTHQRDYAQTVRNSGEALLGIINDILDFSKIEAGKLEIENVAFDLRTTVADVLDLLAEPAQRKGLELVAIIDTSIPGVLEGDPGRVRQILINLIGNAIKFTQTGEIVVSVMEDQDGPDTVLRFEVSDTGDGIAPDKLETIFHPFVQADTSTSRKYGGTGLGLAISGQLVALMGGDCGVYSKLGSGSTFWFTISVHVESDQAEHSLPSPDMDLAGVTALIVDDSASQRTALSEFLTHWGMTVSTADSGEIALEKLRAAVGQERPFAVVLLDLSMPGMDGLEAKNQIVGDPSLTHRLVLMTGLGQTHHLEDGEASAQVSTLSKPIHRDELRACLRVVLGLEDQRSACLEPAESAPVSHVASPATARLLLVEDNLINQKVALAMLSGAGYLVDTVLDGAAAVKAVAAQPYDAVLMDCQMPELNGYEATAAIRAQEGQKRHTQIIAMTAGARSEDRDRCFAEGMDSYLAKPVTKEALLTLVGSSVTAGRT